MDPEQRPIHCSDKRGTSLYIKDDDTWKKDGDGKMLDSQIGAVTKKHIDILKSWEEAHPKWRDSESETKTYIELVQKITGGSSEEERIKNCRQIQRKIGRIRKSKYGKISAEIRSGALAFEKSENG